MAKVIGLGGLFFKAKDQSALQKWYETHLGIPSSNEGTTFTDGGPVIWSVFPDSSTYFKTNKPFMMNFRVDDLDALLAQLESAGVEIDPKREDYDFGRFAWIVDPEGNRVELWQPGEE